MYNRGEKRPFYDNNKNVDYKIICHDKYSVKMITQMIFNVLSFLTE